MIIDSLINRLPIPPRWRKVLFDLTSNRARSMVVISSISVGLFALGMTLGGNIIIGQDMQTSYQSTYPANILIIAQPFDQNLINSVRNLSGVARAEGRREWILRARSQNQDYIQFRLIAFDPNESQLNLVKPVNGKWPPQDNEISLEINKLKDLNVQIGDMIDVELPSGKVRSLKVVGTVQDLSIGSMTGTQFTEPVQGYITLNMLEKMDQPRSLNYLYVRVSGDPMDSDHVHQVASQVNQHLENSGRQTYTSKARVAKHPNIDNFNAVSGILSLLGLVSILLSAFLISNTLSALLSQHQRYIGIMKSIGATTRQITTMYLVFILIFSLLAYLIAMPLGAWAAYRFAGIVANRLNFVLQDFRAVPSIMGLQLVIALLVPQVSGFIPVIKGTNIPILQAMNGNVLASASKKNWTIRMLENIRGLSNPMMLSLRNTFRKQGRLILTLITLTLGGAIFIAIFNVQASLDRYIDLIGRYFKADVMISLGQNYRADKIEVYIKEVPGIDAIEAWAVPSSKLVINNVAQHDQVNLLAVPPQSQMVDPTMLKGRWLQPGDSNAIIINDVFVQRHPDLDVGQTLTLDIGGRKLDWQIVGIFQLFGGSQLLAYVNYDYLTQKTFNTFHATYYRIKAKNTGLTIKEQNILGQQISDHIQAAGFQVVDVKGGKQVVEQAAGAFNFLVIVLLMMAALTAVVGAIGLSGTMGMNIMERTREIGILRAIGASDRAIMRLVVVESVLIGWISWVFGALFSIPVSMLMSNIISWAIFKAPAYYAFSPNGYLAWLSIVTVLSFAASVAPARSAARLTIREVLAYE